MRGVIEGCPLEINRFITGGAHKGVSPQDAQPGRPAIREAAVLP